MIHDTISKIEERIRAAESVGGGNKAELLKLLAALKAEVDGLSQTHAEDAQSIAGFTAVSTHEATREGRNQELVDLSLKGLSSSVQGLEGTHPKVVQLVNSICTMLSNLGI